jgi:hypothetical protein
MGGQGGYPWGVSQSFKRTYASAPLSPAWVIPCMCECVCVCDTMVMGMWACGMTELSRVCYSRWCVVQMAIAPGVGLQREAVPHLLNIPQLYHTCPHSALTLPGVQYW